MVKKDVAVKNMSTTLSEDTESQKNGKINCHLVEFKNG